MKKIYLFLTLALSLILAGCGHNPQKPQIEYIYKTKVVLLEPPAHLYRTIDLVAPPEKAKYLEMTCEAKERTLTELYIKQNNQLAIANKNAVDIGYWVARQKEIQLKETKEK